MTIFNSAFSTAATAGYVTTKLAQALEANYYHSNTVTYKENVCVVQGQISDIPAFSFPYICKLKEGDVVFFDARNITNVDRAGTMRIRDETEYQSRAIQAQLALDWHHGYQSRIRDISALGLVVYAHWLGEVIAKRFALDARTQLQVSVLAGVFYLNNFWDKSDADKEDVGFLLSSLTRVCGYKHSDVVDIIETHPIIRSVSEFCDIVKEFTQNVRLEDLNPATLYGVVGGSWFLNSGREVVAVALEYPPVWLSMLFQAITNRGFKKAGLTQLVERTSYKKYHEEFVRNMAYLGMPDQ